MTQLAAYSLCTREVRGSNPLGSIRTLAAIFLWCRFCKPVFQKGVQFYCLGGWCNWQTQRLLISRVEDSNSSPLTNANGQRHKHWGVQMDPVSESASGAKPSGRSSAGCPCPTENFDAAPRNVAFAFPTKKESTGRVTYRAPYRTKRETVFSLRAPRLSQFDSESCDHGDGGRLASGGTGKPESHQGLASIA